MHTPPRGASSCSLGSSATGVSGTHMTLCESCSRPPTTATKDKVKGSITLLDQTEHYRKKCMQKGFLIKKKKILEGELQEGIGK